MGAPKLNFSFDLIGKIAAFVPLSRKWERHHQIHLEILCELCVDDIAAIHIHELSPTCTENLSRKFFRRRAAPVACEIFEVPINRYDVWRWPETGVDPFGHIAVGRQVSSRAPATDYASAVSQEPRSNPKPAIHRTVSFSLGTEARRVFFSALGLGSRRKRVWHHAKSTPTSSRASERPHGQANSMTARTR